MMTFRSVCSSLVIALTCSGCALFSKSNNSQNPGANSNNQPETGSSSQEGSRVRTATAVHGDVGAKKARILVKPQKPPRPTGPKVLMPGDAKPSKAIKITQFVPNVASAGTVVEVFGAGLNGAATNYIVDVAGIRWPVRGVEGGKLLVQVPPSAKTGQMVVERGAVVARAPGTFRPMVDDGLFGRPAGSIQGLLGEVFAIGASTTSMPDFSQLGPASAIMAVETIDVASGHFTQGFPSTGGAISDRFAIRFRGSFNLVQGGEIDLCLKNDDGAQLLLEDTMVVDNDGVHKATEVCELVYLEEGEYSLELRYFQAAGPEVALQFSWGRDGGPKQIVPAEVLFRPENGVPMPAARSASSAAIHVGTRSRR